MRIGILAALTACLLFGAGAQAAERGFYTGYVGTLPPDAQDRARTYFERPEVRKLLVALEDGPVTEARAVQILSGTDTKLADLTRLRLVRDDAGLVRIGFAYFTARDVAAIHAATAKYVPSLVAQYKARAATLNAILARYPVASVGRARLAFVLIAGFGLNWDALDLLMRKGYRAPLLVQGRGWQYSFWASQDTPGYSYKGFYWGSSTVKDRDFDPPLDFAFSSFGDPFSDPRMNFPDLLALPADQMTPAVKSAALALGLRDETAFGQSFKQVLGASRARDIGAMLFAMRDGATTRAQICAGVREGCGGLLGLLAASGYIAVRGADRYALRVAVFDTADKPMIDAALALHRAIAADWLARNYAPMREMLSGLTAVRQGVPYAALYSQIWHETFGLATRMLVAQGVIEDPYATAWKGSIPAVWRVAVYHHDWQ